MGRVPVNHRLLACSVAVMWGLNFIAIHASLEHFPPLFLAALRFALIAVPTVLLVPRPAVERSEEHTSELQSLMRISYAVFCLKKNKNTRTLPPQRPPPPQ